MNSLLQNEKRSIISGRTVGLHKHHIFFGNPGRKLSEKYGCWCYLTMEEHTGKHGVHNNRPLDLMLKQKAQEAFETIYGHEKFMEVFGRNYLV